jgi:hypothetical protein
MQGLARLVQVQGRALSGSVLQHLRVEGSAFSSTIQARKESGQPSKDSLEEHGFERSTIADILKEKGQKADGSWLWCTVDETVYDAVKHMTSHNVGALLVVKPGEAKALAGIITERGEFLESRYQTLCEFTFDRLVERRANQRQHSSFVTPISSFFLLSVVIFMFLLWLSWSLCCVELRISCGQPYGGMLLCWNSEDVSLGL